MFNFFKKKYSSAQFLAYPGLSVETICLPTLNFDGLKKGIDNVHIDVLLTPRLTQLSQKLIYELLDQRSSTKRRATDQISVDMREKLGHFNSSYESILIDTIHRSKTSKEINLVQLLQISVIKYVLTSVKTQAARLLDNLRKNSLTKIQKNLALSKRIAWFNHNKNHLLYLVTHDIFEQIKIVETGKASKLRVSLLGMRWTVPEEMLFNPLLQSAEIQDKELLMRHYVLLSSDFNSIYSFKKLNDTINQLFEDITPFINEKEKVNHCSWQDAPANMDILFNIEHTKESIKNEPEQSALLSIKLHYQNKVSKMLTQTAGKMNLALHVLAAYETPRLYDYYAKLLPPHWIYQTLCNDIGLDITETKLVLQLKVRPLQRKDKVLDIKELKETKKRITKLARRPDLQILKTFLTDFIRYRRDLKYYNLVSHVMQKINLQTDESKIRLSRSNGMLYEFFEKDENVTLAQDIRNHVIIKADLRGSTTLTTSMDKQGLNPATHFGQNFFKPISILLDDFGAEKVFIEGDAIILSLFEDNNISDQWYATARSCGLAQKMLEAIYQQNTKNSHNHNLPKLELGIGICYCPNPPKFLYDDQQKIMISPAIGDADRLSSCSWKLRRKYANHPNLLTNVMVFQQAPDDAFKGEKGMTTFRYNLNGIELHPDGFTKLQEEINLTVFKHSLTGDNYTTRFYVGTYPDTTGKTNQIVIREGQMKIWQEEGEDYPLTDTLYYEVVTNQKILDIIKKLKEETK